MKIKMPQKKYLLIALLTLVVIAVAVGSIIRNSTDDAPLTVSGADEEGYINLDPPTEQDAKEASDNPKSININIAAFEALLLVYVIIAYRLFFRLNIFLTILKGILSMLLFITSYWLFILAYAYVLQLVFAGP